MQSDDNEFAKYLRHWRLQRKMKQPELAKATQTTKQNISNFERGRRHPDSGAISKPSLQLAIRLAKVLERPVDEFLVVAGLVESGDVGNAVAEGSSQSKRNVIPSPEPKATLDKLGFMLDTLPEKELQKRLEVLRMFTRDIEREREFDQREE